MNLQEQISRIQEMMGADRPKNFNQFLIEKFDQVFDKLELEKTEENHHQYDWVTEKGKKLFERNHWGRFWIYSCSTFKDLLLYPKMIGMSYKEFEKTLINYLNERYKSEFEDQPLKDIGDEQCEDLDEYLDN